MTNLNKALPDDYPLVVDMDDTLLATDSLWEGLFAKLQKNPFSIFKITGFLPGNKLGLKQFLLDSEQNIQAYPLNSEIMEYLEKEKQAGRKIYLATASLRPVAQQIAERTGFFSEIFTSDETVNLKGENKARFLEERFGTKGYDYIGDCESDLPVWKAAHTALVYGSEHLEQKALKINKNVERIKKDLDRNSLKIIIQEMRINQWIKNLLVFIPVLLSHNFTIHNFFVSILAFLSISFCASAIYVINDILDLASDRKHPVKNKRPFASGKLSPRYAPFIFCGAICFSLLFALPLPWLFLPFLGLYLLTTISYSFFLKKMLLVDVIILAFLYILRIKLGGIATNIVISSWVYAFMGFFFLGLALMKRTSDFWLEEHKEKLQGRAYENKDIPILEMMQIASGFSTVIVLALYIESTDSLLHYSSPGWLWLMCPAFLWWYCNMALLTRRGKMKGDPILFAVHEKSSYLTVIVLLVSFLMAM